MLINIPTRAELATHPLTQNIPWAAWVGEIFEQQAHRDELMRMQGTLVEASQPLNPDETPERALTCLMLGHPLASADELFAALQRMNISEPDIILEACAVSGNESFLDRYLTDLEPDALDALIEAGFHAYQMAAECGFSSVLQRLDSALTDEQKRRIYDDTNCYSNAYAAAAKAGSIPVLQYLETILEKEEIQETIQWDDYEMYCDLAESGLMNVMAYLHQHYLAGDEQTEAFFACNYAAYHSAAEHGHKNVLLYLEGLDEITEEYVAEAREANNYFPFCRAAANGHLSIVTHLTTDMTPEQIQDIIRDNDYSAWCAAAAGGHLPVLEHLEPYTKGMELEFGIRACQDAAKHGRVEVLKYLLSLMESKQQAVLENENYWIYRVAATNGHLPVLQFLETRFQISREQTLAIIQMSDYYAYVFAAANGHAKVLDHFDDCLTPQQRQDAIASHYFYAWIHAASRGDLAMLQRLEPCMTAGQKEVALAIEHSSAAREAIKNNQVATLMYLVQCGMTDADIQYILEFNQFETYSQAAKNGAYALLLYLESLMTEFQKRAAKICLFQNHPAVFMATQHGIITNHLLQAPDFFEWVILHAEEYRDRLRYFVGKKFREWREQSDAFAMANPDGVFNLDEQQQRTALRCAWYWIQNDTPAALERFQFVLGIPGVATRAHEAIRAEPNALLRCALFTGNEPAAAILLNLPNVSHLAEQHDFYRDELHGQFDLRAMARDTESSMRSLSPGERRRLELVRQHYQPLIEPHGSVALLEALRLDLETRYRVKPAFIIRNNGARLDLPPDFASFATLAMTDPQEPERLPLSEEEQHTALRAYYRHPVHTALRWILKPNQWMAPDAAYVEGDPAHYNGYATFESYRDLLVLLWFAAKDEATPATDGHTLKGRMTNFICELGLINRAHNWDRERSVTLPDGREVQEYYDDQEGDKPSCYSGVNRRLFQSVIGHPLLRPFGEDVLELELLDFARQHFSDKLQSVDLPLLVAAKDAIEMLEPLSDEQQDVLKQLDFSNEEITAFLARMHDKYEQDWGAKYQFFLTKYFALGPSCLSHVERLWALTNFSALLQAAEQARPVERESKRMTRDEPEDTRATRRQRTQAASSSSSSRFFPATPPSSPEQELQDDAVEKPGPSG